MGINRYGNIGHSFWDVETSAQTTMCGVELWGRGCDDANGKTSAEMKIQSSFVEAGWDFLGEHTNGISDVWIIPPDGGYPKLAIFNESHVPHELRGSGTLNDPYQIATPEDLGAIYRYDWSACYKMVADIDLSDSSWTAMVIGDFHGRFDGASFTISNLTIRGEDYLGLFRILGSRALVKNLRIESANLTGLDDVQYFGALAAKNKGSITNCYTGGSVHAGDESRYLGGLVGDNEGIITDCHTSADVTGAIDSRILGGLVGNNENGTITNCFAEGTITDGGKSGEFNGMFGGLVGRNGGNISNCHAKTNVLSASYSDTIGGLVGYSWGNLSSCYATGHISTGIGSDYIGGLVGWNSGGLIAHCYTTANVSATIRVSGLGGLAGNNEGNIINCYSNGPVSSGVGGRYIGGLVGKNWYGTIADCYTTSSLSCEEAGKYVGGLVGYNENSSVSRSFWHITATGIDRSFGGVGLTTAQMQDVHTFLNAGWDFVGEHENGTSDLWLMSEADKYPELVFFTDSYQPHELDGTGTPDEPYKIATAEDLGAICHYNRSACYELAVDIDLSDIKWTTALIWDFEGRFDGAGYVLSNLTIDGSGHLGLFDMLSERAIVENLGIEDANIVTGDFAEFIGVIAGGNEGTINDCHASGSIGGGNNLQYVGGLVGFNAGSITYSHANGAINSNEGSVFIGGLVGYNVSLFGALPLGTIIDCSATGSITVGDNCGYLGGLVGYNESMISRCYANKSVSSGSNSDGIGGLVGFMGYLGCFGYHPIGSITDCYVTGSVSAGQESSFVGGMVGEMYGTTAHCYTSASVSGVYNSKYLGGFVGASGDSTFDSCYFLAAVDGGGPDNAEGGQSLTDEQMKQQASFIDWDFIGESENGIEDIWWILEGQDYPRLWWETDNN